nr:hypothetical protein BaRGS_021385 [Batillaria attramentaria]
MADSALLKAAKQGNTEEVKRLIAQNADVSVVDEDARTALYLACTKDNTEVCNEQVCRLLIQKGAEVKCQNTKGETPLHLACTDDRKKNLVELLLDSGADVTIEDKKGRTPLHVACEYKKVTELLLQRGADVNEKNSSNEKDGKGVSRQEEVKVSEAAPTEGHVMISYQWTYQKTVLKIRDELKKRNFRVWLDVDHMTGNIMDAMAAAVDGATAVLMCVSSSYKDSKNCRAEIEYAYTQQKPIVPLLMEADYRPTGWLGIMLGNKLYFDFSGKYPFKAKMEELVRELERQGLRT